MCLRGVRTRGRTEMATKKREMGSGEEIKRLLVLLLYKLGSTSDEIGTALGVDSSTVRGLFTNRRVKKVNLGAG